MPDAEEAEAPPDEDAADHEGYGSSNVASPSSGKLPFSPPEAVQKWLKEEDWQALSSAWEDAESRALAWAEGDEELEADDACLWSPDDGSRRQSMLSNAASMPSFTAHRRKPQWDEGFALIGSDNRKPVQQRRYFDEVPGETEVPRIPVRQDVKLAKMKKERSGRGVATPRCAPQGRVPWCETHGEDASVDNPDIHPFLRHYFDRRGIESSYRQRPHVDKVTPVLLSRTPRRPGTREKLMKYCQSEPSLNTPAHLRTEIDTESRGVGNIHWGTRCLMYGPDKEIRQDPEGNKLPWVYDHNVSEAEDNEILNPVLRHYFEVDGLESSFRNRGRHYGRKIPSVMGIEIPLRGSDCSTTAPNTSYQGGSQNISSFEANYKSVCSGDFNAGDSVASHTSQLASFEQSMALFKEQMGAPIGSAGSQASSGRSGKKGSSKKASKSSSRPAGAR